MKRACPRTSNGREGFTIVEVLLAMFILLLGATAIIGFLTFGAAMTRHAQLRTAAASALDAVAADIDHQLFPYVDGELQGPVDLEDRAVPGAENVVYSAKAAPNPENDREWRVDIEMTWKSAGVKRSKKWSTLRIRELAFGERLRREFIEGKGGFKNTSRAAGSNGE